MGLAMIWYAISARKWFKGPRINVEHTNMDIVEGVDDVSGSGSASNEGEEIKEKRY